MKTAIVVLVLLLAFGLIVPIIDAAPVSAHGDAFWSFSEIGALHLWPNK